MAKAKLLIRPEDHVQAVLEMVDRGLVPRGSKLRKSIDFLLASDAAKYGEHSLEFLKIYFAAIMLIRSCLIEGKCKTPEEQLGLVSILACEFAERINAILEHEVEIMGRMQK